MQARISHDRNAHPSVRLSKAWIVTKQKIVLHTFCTMCKNNKPSFLIQNNVWWWRQTFHAILDKAALWQQDADFLPIFARSPSVVALTRKVHILSLQSSVVKFTPLVDGFAPEKKLSNLV